MKQTPASLESLDPRDLDALVAEIVMQEEPRVPKRCCHTGAVHHSETVIKADLPYYSSSWGGFGSLVERMLALGWTFDVDATAPELGIDVSFHLENPDSRAKGTAATLPRAAAIAALLAAQEGGA